MSAYHFERALFVVGKPDSGKSAQLRSMFQDVRLGCGGVIPTAAKVTEVYRLSNERCLYLRITSPHEMHESLTTPRAPDDPISFFGQDRREAEHSSRSAMELRLSPPAVFSQPNA